MNELVNLIKYEFAPGAEANLAKASQKFQNGEKSSKAWGTALVKTNDQEKTLNKTTDLLNSSFSKLEKGIGGSSKMMGSLLKGFMAFGVVGAVTSGIMGAWGINAAESAKDLKNLSYSLQLSTKEVQAFGAAFEQLGGNKDNLYNDAKNFYNMTGQSLTLQKIEELSKRWAEMSEGEALREARTFGFSDETARIFRNNYKQFKNLVDQAERFGQVNTQEQLENLSALDSSWKSLKETISVASTSIQGEIVPGLTSALDALNNSFSANQGTIQKWSKEAGGFIENFVKGATGQIGDLEKRISQFNGKPLGENARSPDPEVRAENLAEMQKNAEQSALGEGAKTTALSLLDSIEAVFSGKSTDIPNLISARYKNSAKTLLDVYSQVAKAVRIDRDMYDGPNADWLEMQDELELEKLNKEWLQGKNNKFITIDDLRLRANVFEKFDMTDPRFGAGVPAALEKIGYNEIDRRSILAGTKTLDQVDDERWRERMGLRPAGSQPEPKELSEYHSADWTARSSPGSSMSFYPDVPAEFRPELTKDPGSFLQKFHDSASNAVAGALEYTGALIGKNIFESQAVSIMRGPLGRAFRPTGQPEQIEIAPPLPWAGSEKTGVDIGSGVADQEAISFYPSPSSSIFGGNSQPTISIGSVSISVTAPDAQAAGEAVLNILENPAVQIDRGGQYQPAYM